MIMFVCGFTTAIAGMLTAAFVYGYREMRRQKELQRMTRRSVDRLVRDMMAAPYSDEWRVN